MLFWKCLSTLSFRTIMIDGSCIALNQTPLCPMGASASFVQQSKGWTLHYSLYPFPPHHSWSYYLYLAYSKSIISYYFPPTSFSSFNLQLMIFLPFFSSSQTSGIYLHKVLAQTPISSQNPQKKIHFCILLYNPKDLINPLTACPVASPSSFSSLMRSLPLISKALLLVS